MRAGRRRRCGRNQTAINRSQRDCTYQRAQAWTSPAPLTSGALRVTRDHQRSTQLAKRLVSGAGDGNRTRVASLEDWALPLSYARERLRCRGMVSPLTDGLCADPDPRPAVTGRVRHGFRQRHTGYGAGAAVTAGATARSPVRWRRAGSMTDRATRGRRHHSGLHADTRPDGVPRSPGSRLLRGARGHRFKSGHPDQVRGVIDDVLAGQRGLL